MKRLSALLFLSISLYFISCGKEESASLNPPTPLPIPAINDSILISTYIELDTTLAAPYDSFLVCRYQYDNLKRLTQKRLRDFAAGPGSPVYLYNYVYNGTDTLPVRMYRTNLASSKTDSTFFTYNSSGFVIKDSAIRDFVVTNPGSIKTAVSKITILTDSLRMFNFGYNTSGVLAYTDSSSRHLVKTGTDVTQEKVYGAVFPGGVLTNDFKFDGNVNPLYKTEIRYPYFWLNSTQEYNAQQHNYVDRIVHIGASVQTHYTFTFTYNANNLPVKAIVNDPTPGASSDINKVLYFYTK